ncbi:class I SAM-dependent methyltransferase [Baia soyae]|uniref:Methyltransferase family protein n=1 Tax=Baia soyae TaxID=1544746 RepID=A0A4R2RXN9_9BACL|nr:class I SAM-dependent methyltransferase [Baia soyae]TCP69303.1 methyltransferase family protein [Baia soyae]
MHVFWEKIIKPICIAEEVETIVEVGAERGANTNNLLPYCKEKNGKLYIIDPAPGFDSGELQKRFGDTLQMFFDLSLSALPKISQFDAIFLDGDHNWYTVYHELKLIEEKAKNNKKYPIIFLHDTEWPFGRRDMYYNPETIPEEFRQPYDTAGGVIQGISMLAPEGGFLSGFHKATYEHGERNGILTAVEDYLKETDFQLSFHRALTNHGLGIILPKNFHRDIHIQDLIKQSGL